MTKVSMFIIDLLLKHPCYTFLSRFKKHFDTLTKLGGFANVPEALLVVNLAKTKERSDGHFDLGAGTPHARDVMRRSALWKDFLRDRADHFMHLAGGATTDSDRLAHLQKVVDIQGSEDGVGAEAALLSTVYDASIPLHLRIDNLAGNPRCLTIVAGWSTDTDIGRIVPLLDETTGLADMPFEDFEEAARIVLSAGYQPKNPKIHQALLLMRALDHITSSNMPPPAAAPGGSDDEDGAAGAIAVYDPKVCSGDNEESEEVGVPWTDYPWKSKLFESCVCMLLQVVGNPGAFVYSEMPTGCEHAMYKAVSFFCKAIPKGKGTSAWWSEWKKMHADAKAAAKATAAAKAAAGAAPADVAAAAAAAAETAAAKAAAAKAAAEAAKAAAVDGVAAATSAEAATKPAAAAAAANGPTTAADVTAEDEPSGGLSPALGGQAAANSNCGGHAPAPGGSDPPDSGGAALSTDVGAKKVPEVQPAATATPVSAGSDPAASVLIPIGTTVKTIAWKKKELYNDQTAIIKGHISGHYQVQLTTGACKGEKRKYRHSDVRVMEGEIEPPPAAVPAGVLGQLMKPGAASASLPHGVSALAELNEAFTDF